MILPDSPEAKELSKVDLAKRMKVRAVAMCLVCVYQLHLAPRGGGGGGGGGMPLY